MKTKIILFFLLLSKMISAQSGNDKIVYLDSLWKETTKEKQFYYRIIKDYYSEKHEYRFETYFKSGKIQMEGNSEIKDYFLRIGLIKEYYESGNIKSESISYS
jgi:antitoxin component YwqK of YwqJK toxin-antitoxin module